eukprot:722120-Karenia_brevis.AAC.1
MAGSYTTAVQETYPQCSNPPQRAHCEKWEEAAWPPRAIQKVWGTRKKKWLKILCHKHVG